MDQTTVKRLTDARDYLVDPAHFTQWRRWSPDNIQNCALGVIERAYGLTTWPDEIDDEIDFDLLPEVNYLNLAIDDLKLAYNPSDGTENIVYVNNKLGHEPTIRMFNRAIELATAD